MQLTYRGHAYQTSSSALPTIVAEQELRPTYRGIPTTVKRYEFKVEKLENPNWRTMRFMGKQYVAAPSLRFVSSFNFLLRLFNRENATPIKRQVLFHCSGASCDRRLVSYPRT